MMDYIDYSRRLTPEEHYCLYRYFLSRGTAHVGYQEFNITEALIAQDSICSGQ